MNEEEEIPFLVPREPRDLDDVAEIELRRKGRGFRDKRIDERMGMRQGTVGTRKLDGGDEAGSEGGERVFDNTRDIVLGQGPAQGLDRVAPKPEEGAADCSHKSKCPGNPREFHQEVHRHLDGKPSHQHRKCKRKPSRRPDRFPFLSDSAYLGLKAIYLSLS